MRTNFRSAHKLGYGGILYADKYGSIDSRTLSSCVTPALSSQAQRLRPQPSMEKKHSADKGHNLTH